jgi:hypothetical protein
MAGRTTPREEKVEAVIRKRRALNAPRADQERHSDDQTLSAPTGDMGDPIKTVV